VVLGAGSPKPSILIKAGNKDTPGALSIHTDLVPEKDDAHSLGNERNRWKSIYTTESIQIGARKGTISYDKDSNQLKLVSVSINELAITGQLNRTTPNDTKFVALDGRGNIVQTDLIRENHQLLLNEIERLSRRLEPLEVENDNLKALFTSDLSWQQISMSQLQHFGSYNALPGFLALSEGYVTISFVEGQYNGDAHGSVVTYELPGGNSHLRSSWTSRTTAGTAYDYAQDCRPIASDGAGKIYELNRKDGIITVYPNPKNNIIGSENTWSLGDQQGRLPGKLEGIAVDRAGQNIYVTFSTAISGGVMKFRSNGTFLHSWSTQGVGANSSPTSGKPTAIAVDDADIVYVAEEALNRIQKFRSDGTFVELWGKNAPRPMDFNAPVGIAIDGMRCIYVSERDTRLIKKLKLSGNHDLLATWDAKYADTDFDIRTEGITVDRVGNVYLPVGIDYFFKGEQTSRLRPPGPRTIWR
jgi:hypothetical protein